MLTVEINRPAMVKMVAWFLLILYSFIYFNPYFYFPKINTEAIVFGISETNFAYIRKDAFVLRKKHDFLQLAEDMTQIHVTPESFEGIAIIRKSTEVKSELCKHRNFRRFFGRESSVWFIFNPAPSVTVWLQLLLHRF